MTTMKSELYDQWLELSKNAAEPMLRLNEISARAMEKVARQQMDLARDYLDLGAKNLKLLGERKDPREIMAEQGDLVSVFGKKLLGRAEEFMGIATDTQKEIATWVEAAARKAAAQPQAETKAKTG
jgi:phasin family protein